MFYCLAPFSECQHPLKRSFSQTYVSLRTYALRDRPPSCYTHDMKYSTAITLPINSPSASVALTQEQCWNALVHKARDPQPFMPIAILDFAITDDRGADGLTRHVRVTDGRGVVQGDYDEIIEYYKPARVRSLTSPDSVPIALMPRP